MQELDGAISLFTKSSVVQRIHIFSLADLSGENGMQCSSFFFRKLYIYIYDFD